MSSPRRVLVTTAIPYVNAPPHIGHALEFVQADVLARYYRQLLGDDQVYFLSGSDENALKNVQSAKTEGRSVQELVDDYSQEFYRFKKELDISFDDFVRTTSQRHHRAARRLWKACQDHIYKAKYTGLYCVGCEAFYKPEELVDGVCPEHKRKPELIEEENYFFRLSAFSSQLEKILNSGKLKITPQFRHNEVMAFINRGLEDFSISRTNQRAKGWGIPVPGDPKQRIYVWFDALINYLTGLGYGSTDTKLLKRFWLSAKSRQIHVIGKGITRFHAIYWPAMLLAAKLPLPSEELVHGYVTIEGDKISKSIGNVIDPFSVAAEYKADPVRYYLLREVHPFKDGDFSQSRFVELYNADLANGLGNLVQRLAKLCQTKSCSGSDLEQVSTMDWKKLNKFIESYRFNQALEFVWQEVKQLDVYIDQSQPWQLSTKKAQAVLKPAIARVLILADKLQPFLPQTAKKVKAVFSRKQIVAPTQPLFPRL